MVILAFMLTYVDSKLECSFFISLAIFMFRIESKFWSSKLIPWDTK